MIHPELAETLIAIVESIAPPAGTGLVVTEVDVEVPLEVYSGRVGSDLVFFGGVPHSRWKSGILPQVHLGKLRIELVPDDVPGAAP